MRQDAGETTDVAIMMAPDLIIVLLERLRIVHAGSGMPAERSCLSCCPRPVVGTKTETLAKRFLEPLSLRGYPAPDDDPGWELGHEMRLFCC